MKEPLIAQTTAQAIQYFLAWFAAGLTFVCLCRFLLGFAKYYIHSGDEEKMRQARSYEGRTIMLFILAFFLSAISFFISKL
ncbi:MAG: hypothetical protein ABIC19_01190 [Patescibacteria group bacterium]|nr:hypothetical protein [Patescibacteria group bacterium]